MDEHQAFERDLLLIAGIPGTGKTCFAEKFAKKFDFLHHDLEVQQAQTLNRFDADPTKFIGELLNEKKNVVVTWGFAPDCERSVVLVKQIRSAGFKLIWFDGNRPAALRKFQKRAERAAALGRASAQEIDFYRQMYRIETSRIVEQLKPTVINSFDDTGQFKPTRELLEEIRQACHMVNE